MSSEAEFGPPTSCPVCASDLTVTRMGCHHCGSEVVGQFTTCSFCRLDESELGLLRVFLAARGNLKEVEKHFGISYPTARQRLTGVLVRLGLSGEAESDGPLNRDQVLSEVATGSLTPAEGARLLKQGEMAD